MVGRVPRAPRARRPGDVALFAFCGHGSEEPAPPEIADFEPTGKDPDDPPLRLRPTRSTAAATGSRRPGARLLIAEVAAGGAHVGRCSTAATPVAGPVTRSPGRGWRPLPDDGTTADRDVVIELAAARPERLPARHGRAVVGPRPPHVALAACRSDEMAKEHRVGDVDAGRVLRRSRRLARRLDPPPTYRSLLATVRATWSGSRGAATGVVPARRGRAGRRPVPRRRSRARSRRVRGRPRRDGWEVDGGLVHGFAPGRRRGLRARLLRRRRGHRGPVRVIRVDVGRSLVDRSAGCRPISRIGPCRRCAAAAGRGPARPAARRPAGERGGGRARRRPGRAGGSGPRRRPVDGGAHRRRDDTLARGLAPARRRAGRRDGADRPGRRQRGRRRRRGCGRVRRPPVASRLEHVAAWELVRALGDHPSPLVDAVTLDVFDARAASRAAARPRPPPRQTAAASSRTSPSATAHAAPAVFIEVHNHEEDDLWVAVLDLTDRFRCHAVVHTVMLAGGRRWTRGR